MYIDCTPNILSRANTFYSFTFNSNAHINVLLYFSISIVLHLCIVAQVKQISFIFQKHACHMPLHWMHWHCVMGIISGFRCLADRLWTAYRIYILFFAKDTASLRRAQSIPKRKIRCLTGKLIRVFEALVYTEFITFVVEEWRLETGQRVWINKL